MFHMSLPMMAMEFSLKHETQTIEFFIIFYKERIRLAHLFSRYNALAEIRVRISTSDY